MVAIGRHGPGRIHRRATRYVSRLTIQRIPKLQKSNRRSKMIYHNEKSAIANKIHDRIAQVSIECYIVLFVVLRLIADDFV